MMDVANDAYVFLCRDCETVLTTLVELSLSRDEDYIRSTSLTGFQVDMGELLIYRLLTHYRKIPIGTVIS
jgi:hypothetical protein